MSSKENIDLTSNETRVEVDSSAKLNTFDQLYNVKIEKYIKKKQGDYLPWSIAWGLFKHYRPDAEYVYEPDRHFESGEVEVVCSVTSLGNTIQMILPVLQNNNRPAISPNRHQVNTARMRCLTKAIAMHGLGLTCWNGVAVQDIEDFGSSDKAEQDSSTATKLEIKAEPKAPELPPIPADKVLKDEAVASMKELIAANEMTLERAIERIEEAGKIASPEQIAQLEALQAALPEVAA